MKSGNCLVSMGDIGCRLPGLVVLVVTDPIHQVIQLAPEKLGAEDLVNLELGKAVHLGGQGRRHNTARERVRHVQLQQADVEHRVRTTLVCAPNTRVPTDTLARHLSDHLNVSLSF